MTAISENLTGDGDISAIFTPSNDTSEFVTKNNLDSGTLVLEEVDPISGEYEAIAKMGPGIARPGKGVVPTPDYAITYRFRTIGAGSDFNVYMGP